MSIKSLILLSGKSRSVLPLINSNLTLCPGVVHTLIQTRNEVTGTEHNFKDHDQWIRKLIGNREIVGYGVNGQPEYVDRQDFPFPSLRWLPPYPEIQALREKERGDWRRLTLEEKKQLYRSSFRQTYAEFLAPTGEWMGIIGFTCILISVGIWLFILQKQYVYRNYLPKSFSTASRRAQLARMITLRVNPITGISSYWDYENMKWKKKPWYIPFDDPFGPEECEEDEED